MRRSLPRPLMPLLLFLYRVAKYSQSLRSCGVMGSFSDICENFRVRSLSVVAWNLFWWDCRSVREELAISGGGAYLEISQLRELLPAVVQQAGKRLRVLVGNFVRADVAALGEALLADITGEGLFAGMAALMGLHSLAS